MIADGENELRCSEEIENGFLELMCFSMIESSGQICRIACTRSSRVSGVLLRS